MHASGTSETAYFLYLVVGLGNIAILSPVHNITMCNINIVAVFELSIIWYVQYIAVCCNIS